MYVNNLTLVNSRSAAAARRSVSEQWLPSFASSLRSGARLAFRRQDFIEQPVHRQIRIPPNRAGEMAIVLDGKRIMPELRFGILRLFHAAEQGIVDGMLGRLVFDLMNHVLESLPALELLQRKPERLAKSAKALSLR